MNTSTIYARISSDLKDKIKVLAKSSGKQQSEILTELLNQGLLYENSQKELKQAQDKLSQQEEDKRNIETELEKIKAEMKIAQQKLDTVERARGHLQRILYTEVGKCTFPNCGAPINLYSFVYQQCPNGHSKKIALYNEYKSQLGVGESLVAGLAIFAGIALVAELLGGESSKGNQ